MHVLFRKRYTYGIAAIIIFVVLLIVVFSRDKAPEWITDTVTEGPVQNIISVSGVIDAVGTAELAFPVTGTVESIAVKEGDTVSAGDELARIFHNDLKADYQDAEAALQIAIADKDELLNGIQQEERAVSATTLTIAQEDLTRTTNEQYDKVNNAYRTLLSLGLEAEPDNKGTNATAPVITGTFTCKEGAYRLDMFSSGSQSGYSYRLSGLENGTYSAYTQAPAPLGKCGLFIQFSETGRYSNTSWTITIPNTKGASYITNLNAYNLALTQKTNAITEAEQKLLLAQQNNALTVAAPRSEAIRREEARVLQAKARLSVIGVQMQDHIIKAPFNGVVTSIDSVPGETVGNEPVITMVSEEDFTLTALIPEIDITEINIGQKAHVVFDARQNEILPATVFFISPLAKEIDGVSYFEAKLSLDQEYSWLKSGLNADIDVVLESRENVTRIPKRYLVENEGSYSVLVPRGKNATSVPVTVTFIGNDGFVEIEGLSVGETVIAP